MNENDRLPVTARYRGIISKVIKHHIPMWERRNCKSHHKLDEYESVQWKLMTEELRNFLTVTIAADYVNYIRKESILSKVSIHFGRFLTREWDVRIVRYVRELRAKSS